MLRYDVEPLGLDTLQIAKPVIAAYEYKPYHYIRGIRNNQLTDFFMEELKAHLQSPQGNYAYSAKDGAETVGLTTLRMLPWDKQIFKKEMATIDYLIAIGSYGERVSILDSLLSKLSSKCKELKIDHLSMRVDTSDLGCIHVLEDAGFKLMDIVLTYCFDFTKSSVKELDYLYRIREQVEQDIEPIEALARLSFQNYIDRFHTDPTLDNWNCDELYAKWARNSCLGLVAERVSVAEEGKEILGFATSKFHKEVNRFIDHKVGEIVLVCVSPKVRGSGVYTSLIHEGLCWFHKRVDFVQVVTQINNIYTQRAWSNLGFRLIGSRSTFHKWF